MGWPTLYKRVRAFALRMEPRSQVDALLKRHKEKQMYQWHGMSDRDIVQGSGSLLAWLAIPKEPAANRVDKKSVSSVNLDGCQ